MATARFVLKEPKGDKETLIYLLFSFKGKRLKYSTGEKILPKFWNKKNQRVKETSKFTQYPEFNTRLKNIDNAINNIYRKMLNDGIAPTPKSLRTELNKKLFPELDQGYISFMKFVDIVIKESFDGTRLTKKGKKISITTIKGYKTTRNHLIDFQEFSRKKVDFENIDLKFYKEFVSYFNKKNYSTNTIGKNVKNLKVFMREATKRGVNTNLKFQDEDFRVIEEETDQIYLNEKELLKLYELDLSNNKRLDNVRDLFIIGCYTGLRFADLVHICPENFIKNETRIKIDTIKTGETVIIPLHWTIKEILIKHNGEIPRIISNQKMNQYLKELGQMAEINEIIRLFKTRGGLRFDSNYKKYELITVHTARRSFATNLYLAGIPTISIMKITGHRTERSFLKYIRITQEENAQKLLEHPYFQAKSNLKIS